MMREIRTMLNSDYWCVALGPQRRRARGGKAILPGGPK